MTTKMKTWTSIGTILAVLIPMGGIMIAYGRDKQKVVDDIEDTRTITDAIIVDVKETQAEVKDLRDIVIRQEAINTEQQQLTIQQQQYNSAVGDILKTITEEKKPRRRRWTK